MVRMAQSIAEDVGEWHKDINQWLGWHRQQKWILRMAQQQRMGRMPQLTAQDGGYGTEDFRG